MSTTTLSRRPTRSRWRSLRRLTGVALVVAASAWVVAWTRDARSMGGGTGADDGDDDGNDARAVVEESATDAVSETREVPVSSSPPPPMSSPPPPPPVSPLSRDAFREARLVAEATPTELSNMDESVVDLRRFRERFPPKRGESVAWTTFGSFEVRDAARNWLYTSLKAGALEAGGTVVFAFDAGFHEWCEDEAKTLEERASVTVTCVDARSSLAEGKENMKLGLDSFRENLDSFNVLMRGKTRCLETLLKSGYDVAMSDVDVAWLKSPLEYYRSGQLANVDIAVSSDAMFHFDGEAFARAERSDPGNGLRYWRTAKDDFGRDQRYDKDLNVGILYLRCTKNTLEFIQDWVRSMRERRDIDQVSFNHLARTRPIGEAASFCVEPVAEESKTSCTSTQLHVHDYLRNRSLAVETDDVEGSCPLDACTRGVSDSDLSRGGDAANEYLRGERPIYHYGGLSGNVRFGVLPTQLFANGITYFSFGARRSPRAFAVHSTYVYFGFAGKIWRFRESGLVENESQTEYLTESGDDKRVLVVRFDIPERVERDVLDARFTPRGEVPSTHIRAMRWQVNRVRDAFAIARVENRTLIIPQYLCGCQRHFHLMDNCTLGGTALPFACPLDHIMAPAFFNQRNLPAREASYFQNRLKTGLSPFAAKAKRIVVCGGETDDEACARREAPQLKGLLANTTGYVPVDTPTDETSNAIVLRSPFKAVDVREAFASVHHDPVVVVDHLGADLDELSTSYDFSTFDVDAEDAKFHADMEAVMYTACCFEGVGTKKYWEA